MVEKTVTVEIDLSDFEDEEIREEYLDRFTKSTSVTPEQIYDEFRKRGDAPQCLRDFLYEVTGRILP